MIDLRTYGAVVRELAKPTQGPRSRRRLAASTLAFPAWEGLVRAGRLADHALSPGFRTQPIEEPVFVIGHQRSGTTFLHRLLALDPRFAAPMAWQLMVPSVTLQNGIERAHAHGLLPFASRLEQAMFGAMASSHVTTWSQPEEDDWLFVHAVATPTLEYLTANPSLTERYWVGDALDASERHRAMKWYRRSVQRLLYRSPPGATLLSKNPHFTGWIRTLNKRFPDARFVMLMRDPAEAIASRLHMLTRAWGGEISRKDPRLRQAFSASCRVYRHAESAWADLPEHRRIRVRYDQLTANPKRALGALYRHFGWTASPAPDALDQAVERSRRRVPRAAHKLRHYGLHTGDLATELGDVDALWQSIGKPAPRPRRR
ncbi:MAG: sulfotransferase [Proteobacteria bacterium]|nr:sulfotransferase [Pseudomonadota bacterium]